MTVLCCPQNSTEQAVVFVFARKYKSSAAGPILRRNSVFVVCLFVVLFCLCYRHFLFCVCLFVFCFLLCIALFWFWFGLFVWFGCTSFFSLLHAAQDIRAAVNEDPQFYPIQQLHDLLYCFTLVIFALLLLLLVLVQHNVVLF